jgi:pimeloyl-ACP methyl ester carboxylesterase
LREQVIEHTLRGAPEAKRAWTDRGMIKDVSAGLGAVTIPVSILVGSRDRVEHESALREVFGRHLPQATFRVLEGIGHLSPLEAPGELADICANLLAGL